MSPPPRTDPYGVPLPLRDPRARRLARWGALAIALGIAAIVWGAFHVLDAIGGYEQLDFAHRKRDYEVRSAVHGSYLPGFLRGLFGLAVCLFGGHLRRRAREIDGASAPDDTAPAGPAPEERASAGPVDPAPAPDSGSDDPEAPPPPPPTRD